MNHIQRRKTGSCVSLGSRRFAGLSSAVLNLLNSIEPSELCVRSLQLCYSLKLACLQERSISRACRSPISLPNPLQA